MASKEAIKEFAKTLGTIPEPWRNTAMDIMRAAYNQGAADYEQALRDVQTGNQAIRSEHGSH